VDQTIGRILSEQDQHLRYLWKETTRDEKLILAALSMYPEAGTEKVSRAEILTRLRRASLSEEIINHALERLLMHDLVKMQVGNGQSSSWDSRQETEFLATSKDYLYSISFDLFRLWIAKKHPLRTLLP
jgi:hypothetical protein